MKIYIQFGVLCITAIANLVASPDWSSVVMVYPEDALFRDAIVENRTSREPVPSKYNHADFASTTELKSGDRVNVRVGFFRPIAAIRMDKQAIACFDGVFAKIDWKKNPRGDMFGNPNLHLLVRDTENDELFWTINLDDSDGSAVARFTLAEKCGNGLWQTRDGATSTAYFIIPGGASVVKQIKKVLGKQLKSGRKRSFVRPTDDLPDWIFDQKQ